MTKEITDKNLQESLDNNGILVIDFWAPWCAPCKMMAPAFEELSTELSDMAVFAKSDVDDNPEAAKKFGITAIPTIVILKNKEIVKKLTGLQQKMAIEEAVLEIINGNAEKS
jgi:thioredoxin 1